MLISFPFPFPKTKNTEYADELEVAEFYEDNSELMLLFLLECYLLMIGKTWINDGNEEEINTLKFAFGNDIKLPSVLEDTSDNHEIIAKESLDPNAVEINYIDKLLAQCQKIKPINDSDFQAKWVNSLKKDANVEVYLKFPLIFSKLLQYVTINRILSSQLSCFLLGMIKRLLHVHNFIFLRVEGLKMLLNLLKAASHESSHEITKSCTEIFGALIDVVALGAKLSGSDTSSALLSRGEPLIESDFSGIEGPSGGVNLEMLNEIMSFMTWDLNPDLQSTRFLYILLRDHFISKLFPLASEKSRLSLDEFDKNVSGNVLELIVDYFALWFLKSSNRPYKFGSSFMNSAEDLSFKNQLGSMVSLVVNDLTNFLGVGNNNRSQADSKKHSRSSMISGHKNEFPVASFLLEEVILGSKQDVILVHYILKSACFTLTFSSNLFCIRLTLEIFRSWLFNPVARRPQFLQNLDELDGYVAFYMDAIEGLFPSRHMKPANTEINEDLQVTLVDRVDIYKEGVYFYRAVALQAFFPLSFERWLHLLSIEIAVVDLLLDPENQMERTYFTTEDALLAETLLGSLLRSSEHFNESELMRKKWSEASNVLTKCSNCRGIIEEWCRVIEALALLLVKDPRYSGWPEGNNSGLLSRVSSFTGTLSSTVSLASSLSGSSSPLPPTTASFSAWPDLPGIKQHAVVLFRNMLRILGDPASSLVELRKNRPDLMALMYESMERCLDIFLKCRMDQSVKIPIKCVPPLGDFLPTALSALLNLNSYTTIISGKSAPEDFIDPTAPSPISTAHDSSRIIAWKMVGVIMFRPADVNIPDHYWGALLVALRESLNAPLSSGEFTAIMLHVGIPVSSAQIPGTTVILAEMIYGMLRFFNDALWSGNSTSAFSSSEASVLIPVTMKIISNSLKLSKMFPNQFDHFREETCLLRVIKMLIGSISDANLLTAIHTTLAEIYCSEVVSIGIENDESDFAQNILELALEDPLKFTRGRSHVHVVTCLSEYISALAHLKIADPSNKLINCDFIVKKLIECIEIGDSSKDDYSEALIRVIQGPLSDWIFYVYQGRMRNEEVKARVCKLIDLRFSSFKSIRVALDQFAARLLAVSSAFPSLAGPEFIGSEGFNESTGGTSLINLVLTPSQTILSFKECGNGEIWITSRNSIGKFIWKMRDIWSKPEDEEIEAFDVPRFNVLKDSEFPLPKAPEGSSDSLKDLLSKIKLEFPETIVKARNILLNFDEPWKDQMEHETEMKFEVDFRVEFERFESKRPVHTGGRISSQLRLLLSSLSLTLPELYTIQPGFGVEILKSESSTGGRLEDELKLLDGISGRCKIKVACMQLPPGMQNESDLFNHEDTPETDHEEYKDFLVSLTNENGKLFTPTIEFEVDELGKMKRESWNKIDMKKHLGNNSVLIVWHGKNDDTVTDGAPFRSDVTSAIIRIRSHSSIPGWYQVSLQTCYERLMQPRKYARVRVDPFTLVDPDSKLDLDADGVFETPLGGSIQRGGILVPMGSLGALVRALSCAAWGQSYLIDCLRSGNAPLTLTAENRVKFAPYSVRQDRIEEIAKRHGMSELPYDQYISSLFKV